MRDGNPVDGLGEIRDFSRGFPFGVGRGLCDRVGSMRCLEQVVPRERVLGEVVPEFLTVERRWVSARIEFVTSPCGGLCSECLGGCLLRKPLEKTRQLLGFRCCFAVWAQVLSVVIWEVCVFE